MRSYAKINLTLDILGKAGNYHLVDTVICEVPNLYDEVNVEVIRDNKSKIEISTDNAELNANPEENLAYKSAKLLAGTNSIKITIKKNIPLRSGLGGGSSNAATVLKELNRQLSLGLDTTSLCAIAKKISVDTPFFIGGGIAYATHFGEKITPIKTNLRLNPKIIFNDLSKTSTAAMYAKADTVKTGLERTKTKELIKALESDDYEGVPRNLHNDFELIFGEKIPTGCHLCGSGPAFFSL